MQLCEPDQTETETWLVYWADSRNRHNIIMIRGEVLLPTCMSSPFSRRLHFCRMRRTPYTMDGFCLLYLLIILLMRSGDVETNPGPYTVESTVSDMEFLKLAHDIHPSYYNAVGISLGFPLAQLHRYLSSKGMNYADAFMDVFMEWNFKQPFHSNKRQLLANKLQQIDLGFLSDRLLNKPPIPNSTDDTGNNKGNDDTLTSLKQDSGSNQDDISFGGLSAPPEILARGPRAQRVYADAAKAGTKKIFQTRLMLVGQERVGKTSLKKALTGQGFDQSEAITDGVEKTNSLEISIEVAKAAWKIWSIHKKGHENEDSKDDEYSKALADEIAKMLIMTPPQDQESLDPHSDTTLGRGLNSAEAEEFVLDNVEAPEAKEEESDSTPNEIASLVEKMLKEQVRLKEIGTDSTDRGEGLSLSIWDFAGHNMYYTSLQMFLTWRAIYVIVFDLSRSLDYVVPPESRDENYEMAKGGAKSELTCLEFINFWLCSIFARAVAPSFVRSKNTSKPAQKSPRIFIVGTHRESVKGDASEKKKKIGSAFEKISESIKKKPFECHVVPEYYAIENSLEDNDEKLVALRRHIEKVAMEEPYMGEEIPLRWLLFEEALAATNINYMSLDQMKELTQPVGIESERELLTMLKFYHDLGYIVYYGGIEDQQSLLQDMVILNPQWLIDVFKQVITIQDPAERDKIVKDTWTTLEEDGILDDRFIQSMLQGYLEQKEALLVKPKAKIDLICEAPVERLQPEQQDAVNAEVSNETKNVIEKRYYDPSELTSHCFLEKIAQIRSTGFYVDFRGFLPDGLFHQLMTKAVGWKGERDGEPVNLLYHQNVIMVDEEHHALLEIREATIKVTVFRGAVADSDHDWDIHKPPAPIAVKEVMDFVIGTLESLKHQWAKEIEYDVCILCPCPNLSCCEKKLFEDCLKRESLKCGIYNIPMAAIKFKFGMSGEEVESGMHKRSSMSGEEVESGMHKRSNLIPFRMAKRLKTEEMNEPARDDTPSTSGQTSSQTHEIADILVKVAHTISDDDLGRLGRELGVQTPDINQALEINRARGTKTSNGNVMMLQNWAKTVESSKLIQTLRAALKRARLLEVEETCFTSSSRACEESYVLRALYFSQLAEEIGKEWRTLGIRLELKPVSIEHITEDNLTAVDRRFAMLQLWKNRSLCTDKGMVEKLCIALISCGRRDLAKRVETDAGIS